MMIIVMMMIHDYYNRGSDIWLLRWWSLWWSRRWWRFLFTNRGFHMQIIIIIKISKKWWWSKQAIWKTSILNKQNCKSRILYSLCSLEEYRISLYILHTNVEKVASQFFQNVNEMSSLQSLSRFIIYNRFWRNICNTMKLWVIE